METMRWTTLSAAVAVLVASKAAGFGARGGRRVGGAFAPRLLSTTSLSMAVTSPTQVTPETQCAEAAKLFLTDANLKFSPTSGGVNNIVQYVEDSQGKKYILRVYNNGLNSVRVKWEHDILNKLKGKTQMSFRIPTMLPALATGETHVKLSTGAEACAMDLIPGALPKLTAVEDIGRASGELCTALADVVVDAAASPNPPYFELFKVHHAVTRDAFFDIMKGPEFDGCRAATTELVAAIVDMEAKIKSPQYMALPKQVTRGVVAPCRGGKTPLHPAFPHRPRPADPRRPALRQRAGGERQGDRAARFRILRARLAGDGTGRVPEQGPCTSPPRARKPSV